MRRPLSRRVVRPMADAPMTSKACSLCWQEESQVGRLIGVQAGLICEECIDLCTGVIGEADDGDWRRWRAQTIHDACSFCGRAGREVGGLIAGRPPVHICRDCIEAAAQGPGAKRRARRRQFWLAKMAVKSWTRFQLVRMRLVAYTLLLGRPRATEEGTACSFCLRSEDQVRGLVRGNAAFICNQCLGMCREITEALGPQGAKYEESELADDEPREVCSFCGKSMDDVRKLIGGRNGCYICDECVSRYTLSPA